MSNVADSRFMNCFNGLALNRINFDEMKFLGGGVQLDAISPQWTAIRLAYAQNEAPGSLPLAAGRLALFDSSPSRQPEAGSCGQLINRRSLRQRP
jgi:hypothetical protein